MMYSRVRHSATRWVDHSRTHLKMLVWVQKDGLWSYLAISDVRGAASKIEENIKDFSYFLPQFSRFWEGHNLWFSKPNTFVYSSFEPSNIALQAQQSNFLKNLYLRGYRGCFLNPVFGKSQKSPKVTPSWPRRIDPKQPNNFTNQLYTPKTTFLGGCENDPPTSLQNDAPYCSRTR